MALYIVAKARFNNNDEIERFMWALANGSNNFLEDLHEVTVEDVIKAIDRGDVVEMVFETDHRRLVSGGELLKEELPGGGATVIEERGYPERKIRDLPRF